LDAIKFETSPGLIARLGGDKPGDKGLRQVRIHRQKWVEITTLTVVLPRLPAVFHGYKLAQVSDFHLGGWLSGRRLAEAIQIVNAQKPDLLAITGDFVTTFATGYEADLIQAMRQAQTRDGIVAVLGNHDHWNDAQGLCQALDQANVKVLNNAVHRLQRDHAALYIAGVDSYLSQKARLPHLIEQLPQGQAVIRLTHEPVFFDLAGQTGRFDLQLSGHSHGGQVVLPFVGTTFLPRYAKKYPRGLYRKNGAWLYTNRGLGRAHLPIRINCPAEITIFELESLDLIPPA